MSHLTSWIEEKIKSIGSGSMIEITYYAVGHFDTCESLTRVSKDIYCISYRFTRLCSYGQSIQRDIIGLNSDDSLTLVCVVDSAFRRVIRASVGGVTKACH